MSEMVDRVAQYLLEHCNSGHDEDDVHWDDLPDKAKALIRQTSRVVIAAMREPTNEMVVSGHGHATASDAWRAMIDTALKE